MGACGREYPLFIGENIRDEFEYCGGCGGKLIVEGEENEI